MEPSSGSKNKSDRKTIEKNRRIRMKDLCSELVSLIPDHHFAIPKDLLAQQDQFEQATRYITSLRERIEELRRKREVLKTCYGPDNSSTVARTVEVREYGSDVEVVLVCGAHKKLMLHQLIGVVEEEGAQVIAVGVSTIAAHIFHTLHAQVRVPRVGVDTSRISERIHELINAS